MKAVTDGAPEPPAANVDALVEREVHPYVGDAWVDHDKTKTGYEIPLNHRFYVGGAPNGLVGAAAVWSDRVAC